jgi:hypothetical protein
MTTEQILAIKKDRLNKLENSPKNIKAPGTVKKLRRQIRAIENSFS